MSEMSDKSNQTHTPILQLVGTIVSAYVRSNQLPVSELSAMINNVYVTLGGLAGQTFADMATTKNPAVSVNKSITPGYIVCLEDGKRLKMLKRHLRSRYDLSPEQYRARWNLPASYPMVAANYSAIRSALAKKFGLGHSSKHSRRRTR